MCFNAGWDITLHLQTESSQNRWPVRVCFVRERVTSILVGTVPLCASFWPQAWSLSSSSQWCDLLKWLTCFQLTQWHGEISNPPHFWLLSVFILCGLVYFLFANAKYELLMQLIPISHTYKQMILYSSLGSWWRTTASLDFNSHRCIRLHWSFSRHHTEWVMSTPGVAVTWKGQTEKLNTKTKRERLLIPFGPASLKPDRDSSLFFRLSRVVEHRNADCLLLHILPWKTATPGNKGRRRERSWSAVEGLPHQHFGWSFPSNLSNLFVLILSFVIFSFAQTQITLLLMNINRDCHC